MLLCLLAVTNFVSAQYDMDDANDTTTKEKKIDPFELKKHIYVGGDVSFTFGNPLYLYLGPLAGYEIYKGASAGINTMYQVQRFSLANNSSISSHAFGGGPFVRYRPEFFEYIFVQTEFWLYNIEDFSTAYTKDRTSVPAWNFGLGYAGGFGNAYYQISLMFDVINDVNNPLPKLIPGIPLYLRYGMVFYLG